MKIHVNLIETRSVQSITDVACRHEQHSRVILYHVRTARAVPACTCPGLTTTRPLARSVDCRCLAL